MVILKEFKSNKEGKEYLCGGCGNKSHFAQIVGDGVCGETDTLIREIRRSYFKHLDDAVRHLGLFLMDFVGPERA
jgi:hypothetical protein